MDNLVKFITFEGADASGKSTQARIFAENLEKIGHSVLLTREPGGSPGAERIRSLILDPSLQLTAKADLFLFMAARLDHVETVIKPALEAGKTVICDRFRDSTMAYQGYGGGMNLRDMETILAFADIEPDLTFVFDAPEDVRRQRLARRGDTDRFELMSKEFISAVRDGFIEIARNNPHRCQLIDSSGPIREISSKIFSIYQTKIHPEQQHKSRARFK